MDYSTVQQVGPSQQINMKGKKIGKMQQRQGDTVLDEKKFKGHDQMKYVDPGFQNNE